MESFVVRMYSSQIQHSSVNMARYELFKFNGKDFDQLPPTKDALVQHVKRASFIAGHIWGQSLQKVQILPSPSEWGFQKNDAGSWVPLWKTLPTISKSHLHICRCKKQCKPPCVCAKNSVICIPLCTCRGDCYGSPRS